jgi:hypothetical protein
MGGSCGCGTQINHTFHELGCIECGATCCPACAVSLESAMYCRGCARSLVGAAVQAGGPLELQ